MIIFGDTENLWIRFGNVPGISITDSENHDTI